MIAGAARLGVCAGVCGAPTGKPLDFSGWGDLGTAPQETWAFPLAGGGGTPPYTFSLAPGAVIWPGYQVANTPDVPYYFSSSQTGAIYGIPPFGVAETPFTTQIEVKDCAGATTSHSLTVRFSALNFNVQSLPPQFSEGQTFSVPLSGIGGVPPYAITLDYGPLPAGVTLDTATNTLGGTPAAGSAGVYYFTLRITDSAGSFFSLNYGMNVVPLYIPAPTTAPHHVVVGTVGEYLSVPIKATGGVPPYKFSLDLRDTLPSGISINPSGAIQGTPTYEFGNWGFRVDVTDSASTPNVAAISFGMAAGGTYPQKIALYSFSGTGNSFTDSTRATGAANWISIYGGVPPYTCSASPNSSVPPGTLIFDYSSIDSEYGNPLTCYLIGSTLAPGDYSLSIRVVDSAGNLADFPVNWHVSALGIWNEYPPYGINLPYLGKPYSLPLLPMGGTPPYTTTPALPYPEGLNINKNDQYAVLSGAPEEAGSYLSLAPKIVDSAGNEFTPPGNISIASGTKIITLTVSSGALGSGTINVPYEWGLDMYGPVHNPPYAITLLPDPSGPNPTSSKLPAGLSLITSGLNTAGDTNLVAYVSGTPSGAGDFSYLLNVRDAKGNIGQRAISMHVWPAGGYIDDTTAVVTSSAFIYNRLTKLFSGSITVTNPSKSTTTFLAPLSLVLTGLPSGVAALNASGTVADGPYYTLSTTPLPPGQSVTFTAEFSDPSHTAIGFIPKTYSGQPQ